jgi:hypothetical protein
MRSILYCLTVLLFFHTFSQNNNIILLDDEPVDPNRYKEIRRTPHIFSEFVEARIYKTNREFIDVPINYNGYTGTFEYKRDEDIIELDKAFFLKIDVFTDKYPKEFNSYMSDTTIFVRGLNPDDYEKFYIQVYGDFAISVFKEFTVFIGENKIENVGNTITYEYFSPRFHYYFVRDGKPEMVKLKKKPILEYLGDKRLNGFVKENKLQVDNEQDLIRLLEKYSQLNSY